MRRLFQFALAVVVFGGLIFHGQWDEIDLNDGPSFFGHTEISEQREAFIHPAEFCGPLVTIGSSWFGHKNKTNTLVPPPSVHSRVKRFDRIVVATGRTAQRSV